MGLPDSWSYLSSRAQLARVESAVLDRFGIDLLPLVPAEAGELPSLDSHQRYVDRWGVERALPEGAGHFYVSRPPLATAERISDLRAYPWPQPNIDWMELRDQARDLRTSTQRALVLNLEVGFLHQVQFVRGFDRWLMDLALDPDFAGMLMDLVLEVWLTEAEAMIDAVRENADIVIYADDIAFQAGPMVSPNMYETLLKPRQIRVFDLLRRSGMKVLYHSCGDVRPLIPDLIEMGVQALNPVQVSAGGMMDTAALKREWGTALTFWGGIDTHSVLSLGNPSAVRNEVWRRLDDLAKDGGYVLTSVHNIQPDVPAENVNAMFDAADEWLAR
jgi:uroporphyrinogen decarboxylase